MNELTPKPKSEDHNPGHKGDKKVLALVAVIVIVATAAFFGIRALTVKTDTASNNQLRGLDAEIGTRNTAEVTNQRTEFLERFQGEPAAVSDLVVGGQVVAIGIANADGSITADIIRLGDFSAEDFTGFLGRRDSSDANSAEPVPGSAGSRGFSGNFDLSEFQDMSPQERQQRFQALRDSGQLPAGFGGPADAGSRDNRRGFRQEGVETIRGEIIDIDQAIITIKSADGGSRLVFYSDETQIFRLQTNQDNTDQEQQ